MCIVFSPLGEILASGNVSNELGSAEKNIKFWDTRLWRESQTLKGHVGGVFSVAFSPQGETLASG